MNLNLPGSRRWRLHDHTRVHASRDGIDQHRYMWSSTTTSGCRTRCTTWEAASCLRSRAARRSPRLAHHARLDGVWAVVSCCLDGVEGSRHRRDAVSVTASGVEARAIDATAPRRRRRDAAAAAGPPPQAEEGALEVRETAKYLCDEARPAENFVSCPPQGHPRAQEGLPEGPDGHDVPAS